jgi:hypothetical protein
MRLNVSTNFRRSAIMSESPGENGMTPAENAFRLPRSLRSQDWTVLLARIREGNCTPFLGAGASYGTLPLGGAVAQEWAAEHNYPLDDSTDLIRVSQFVAVEMEDAMYPKEEIARRFKNVAPPDFNLPDDPHGFMADLPLPVYITTNYDDFMVKALRARGKQPEQEFCRWNSSLYGLPSVFDRPDYVPRPETPLVFHLHGHAGHPASLVLTEDDYLDFLIAISKKDARLLPPRIQEAMAGASLLFVGYRIADWNFRVLFRSLVSYLEVSQQRKHVSVQVLPLGDAADNQRKLKALNYLDKYYKELKTRVYWGTGREFMAELKERWGGGGNGN